jgi:membrane protein implicated in regulation of membrane protease activity
MFVSSVYFVVPSIFSYLIVHGRPFIEPRADLTGSFMGFACILFFLKNQQSRHFGWLLFSFAAFVALLLPLSRATFLGFVAAVILLILSGQSKFLIHLAVFCVVAIMTLTPIVLSVKSSGEATYATMLRDKILSVVEPFGNKRSFASEVGDASAANNEFRAAWWESVIGEASEKSPVFGLGFGYDLAKRFLRRYTAAMNPYEFDARSPHSILLTIYGRMGLIGILTLGFVIFQILRSSLRCATAVRTDETLSLDVGWWCGVVAILVTSCFGVMLEGPMAAIVFWSLLGMTSYREWERSLPKEESRQETSSKPRVLQPAPM